jgi:hypothetical protein
VVRVSSRLHALRWFAVAALVPPLVFLVAMPRNAALLLALMWVVLIGTVGLAATSRRPERPSTYHPRGRLHG